MALHGEQNLFGNLGNVPGYQAIPNWNNGGLGTDLDRYTAFTPICNGTIANPV
jgi:hypothetical protein